MRPVLVCVALVCVVPCSVFAGDAEPALDCATSVSTAAWSACADERIKEADAALDDAYNKAVATIPDMAGDHAPYDAESWQEALRASQAAWFEFREAECTGHVPLFGAEGTSAAAEVLNCLTEMARERTAQLQGHYAPD